jgi:hypothetical protein
MCSLIISTIELRWTRRLVFLAESSNLQCRDYEANEALDTYEAADLDEQNYEDMDADQRRAVEKALNQRDMRDARRQGLPGAFLDDGKNSLGNYRGFALIIRRCGRVYYQA